MPEWCEEEISFLTNSWEPLMVSLIGLVAAATTDLRFWPLELELRVNCGPSALVDLARVMVRGGGG
jgi:hypothetical protein